MDLEINKIYSTKDIIKFLGVSESKWKKERDELLTHLSNFYEYEVIYDEADHRKRNYHIISQLAEYKEYVSLKRKDLQKRDKLFESEIMETIESDNLQTAKNISRIIDDNIKAEFDYQSGTIYEYTRLRVNEWFGKGNHKAGTKGMITEKIWCYLDEEHNFYVPLDDNQISEFFSLYGEQKREHFKPELDIMSDYENGLITKEEMTKQIGDSCFSCFSQAKKLFKKKYGYYPIKVPKYEIGVFSDNAFKDVEIPVQKGDFSF